jgi:hypothetical protein
MTPETLEHIANLVSILAWPVAIVCIAYLFGKGMKK